MRTGRWKLYPGLALVLPGLLAALLGPDLVTWTSGFTWWEIHPWMALAPMGSLDVPMERQDFDGDEQWFNLLDLNRDGELTFSTDPRGNPFCPELEAAAEQVRPCLLAAAAAVNQGRRTITLGACLPPGGSPGQEMEIREMLGRTRHLRHALSPLLDADRNRDGRITRQEYPGAPLLRPMILGGDSSGRDLLARLILGARTSLLVALLAVTMSLLIGTLVGLLAGVGRGDRVIMRLVDVIYGLPMLFVVMLVFLAARNLVSTMPNLSLEQSSLLMAGFLFLALGAIQWPSVARLVRGRTGDLMASDFITACRAMGMSRTRLLVRHLLPHLLPHVLVFGLLLVPSVMLEEAFLSFLGFGIQPPYPSFGSLLREGLDLADLAPRGALIPLAALTATTMGLHLITRGLSHD